MADEQVTGGKPTWISWTLLALAISAGSLSAILIRYAGAAEPLAIAFWRCAAGAVVLAPFGRRGFAKLAGGGWKLPLVAGAFLAVHFGTWITSVDKTTVANSVLLLSTIPVFTALAARILLREKMRQAVWVGIGLALAGTAVIAVPGGEEGRASLVGDTLALIGAITLAGYAFTGQISRRRLGIVEYSVITYGAAALLLLPVCLAAGISLSGYPASTWLALAGILAGPQLLGHTVLNFVLKELDSTTVTAAIMAEPPIAIALAFVLFSEAPSVWVYPAGLAILCGILIVSVSRGRVPEIIE